MSSPIQAKIMILGAGFGGVYCARELVRLLPHHDDGKIVLVDQHNFFLFTPMLTEIVGGMIDPSHIVNAVRRLSPCVHFVQGRVDSIDLHTRQVTVAVGENDANIPEETQTYAAEQIVIALGSVTNFRSIPGLSLHALTIDSLGDAATIRNRALALLERADAEEDAEQRRALLTFVVGGGGYSGVETVAALNDLLREAAQAYNRIDPREIRMLLVHAGKRLLPELTPSLAAYAQEQLTERGVEVRLNTPVTGAGEDWVQAGMERIATHLLVWSGGLRPSPIIDQLPCKRGKHGGITVDAACRVPEFSGVWALGDCAEIPMGGGETYAPTAQNATREGTQVARNIVATLRGQPPKPFRYQPIGELALVGKRTGVARVWGLQFSGVVAWAMWRAVYLAKLPRFNKRVRVLTDWLLDWIFPREIAELPVSRSTLFAPLDNQERGQ